MKLRPELEKLKRPAWIPVVAPGDGDVVGSKFSGVPALLPGEPWPACGNCGQPLQLFLQLNTATLPAELKGQFGDGLLQLFYCVNDDPQCEVDAEAWAPFSKSVVARRIPSPATADRTAIPPARFPARRIVSWTKVDDLLNWEEADEFGIEMSDEEMEEMERLELPRSGDKLAGWPDWIQGVEYPACPKCRKTMKLVFQVDSEDNVPHMFGDGGIGHLTQCPDHKDVLGFGWACS